MNRRHFIAAAIAASLSGGGAGAHRLRQAGRTGQAGGRLPAVLHAGVVRRGDARQEVLREVPAEGLERRVPDRPAGRDHREQHARRQAAHRLHGRHAGDRLDHQAGGGRHPAGRRARPGLGPVQRLPRAQRRAAVQGREGSDQVARRQDGRGAEGLCTDRFRAGDLQEVEHPAQGVPEPEHRGDHVQLPRRQARRGGDVGADHLAAGRGRARAPRRHGRERAGERRRLCSACAPTSSSSGPTS